MASCEEALGAGASASEDLTLWLPDEIILDIFLRLPPETLWSGVCEQVCRRWESVMASTPIVRYKHDTRWVAYEKRVILPRVAARSAVPTGANILAMATGVDGRVYCSREGETLLALDDKGEGRAVNINVNINTSISAITVGPGGSIYTRSGPVISVWNGDDFELLRTLRSEVYSLHGYGLSQRTLAVGSNGKVYAATGYGMVAVWSANEDEETPVNALVGHRYNVSALVVGLDGKVYSGGADYDIFVWSGDDEKHLQTLEGHEDSITALAVGPRGMIYSGSRDNTVRVWSGDDGSSVFVLRGHTDVIWAIAMGPAGKVFSGSNDRSIRVWSGQDGSLLHTLAGDSYDMGGVLTFAVGLDGTLFAGCICRPGDDEGKVMMW